MARLSTTGKTFEKMKWPRTVRIAQRRLESLGRGWQAAESRMVPEVEPHMPRQAGVISPRLGEIELQEVEDERRNSIKIISQAISDLFRIENAHDVIDSTAKRRGA